MASEDMENRPPGTGASLDVPLEAAGDMLAGKEVGGGGGGDRSGIASTPSSRHILSFSS